VVGWEKGQQGAARQEGRRDREPSRRGLPQWKGLGEMGQRVADQRTWLGLP